MSACTFQKGLKLYMTLMPKYQVVIVNTPMLKGPKLRNKIVESPLVINNLAVGIDGDGQPRELRHRQFAGHLATESLLALCLLPMPCFCPYLPTALTNLLQGLRSA